VYLSSLIEGTVWQESQPQSLTPYTQSPMTYNTQDGQVVERNESTLRQDMTVGANVKRVR